MVVRRDVGAERAALLAGPRLGVDPGVVEEGLSERGILRVERLERPENRLAGLVPRVGRAGRVGEGSVAVVVRQLVEAQEFFLGVVVPGHQRVSGFHDFRHGLHDLRRQFVAQVAGLLGVFVAAQAVVGGFGLHEVVLQKRDQPAFLREGRAERLGTLRPHGAIRVALEVERLGDRLLRAVEGNRDIGRGLIEEAGEGAAARVGGLL